MRLVEADLDRTRITMPNLWSLVKDPEAFWGDLGTQGRLLLKELLEGTMEACRDAWVEVPWHQPDATRKTHRNGFYPRPGAPGLAHGPGSAGERPRAPLPGQDLHPADAGSSGSPPRRPGAVGRRHAPGRGEHPAGG
jgi:hypothetical protein